jgi:hypothetical protein
MQHARQSVAHFPAVDAVKDRRDTARLRVRALRRTLPLCVVCR